jgi:hypothetical protein
MTFNRGLSNFGRDSNDLERGFSDSDCNRSVPDSTLSTVRLKSFEGYYL